ncbi:MAG: SGNH/GDSL hydrolase family protein [Chloroflexi bacterium]|nr:SGNH/GDSL hydrolase family protein [Chloroflexota bacterium]
MKGLRYLALGDSYTIGEGVEPHECFPHQLAARLRGEGFLLDDPEIIARTGWTTDELRAGIQARAPRGPYDLVTLLIGVNNQYRGRDVENYRVEFVDLVERAIVFAGNRPARVVVLSIPDWGVTPFAAGRANISAEIDAFNAVNRAETLRLGAQYLDITRAARQARHDATLIAGDGLHPSPKMYRAWVEQLVPYVLELAHKASM